MAEEPRNPGLQAAEEEFVRLGTDEAKLNLLAQVRPASELLQADIDRYLGYEAPDGPAPLGPPAAWPSGDDPLPPDVVDAVKAARRGASGQVAVHRVATLAERQAQQAWLARHRREMAHRGSAALPWWVTPWTVLLIVFLVCLATGH